MGAKTGAERRVHRRLMILTLGACAVLSAAASAHPHQVQPGETLSQIGAANGVSAEAVAQASGRAVEALLPVGAIVEVPAPSAAEAGQPVAQGAAAGMVVVPAATGTAYLRPDAAAAFAALRRDASAQLGIDIYPAGPQSGWRSRAQQVSLWHDVLAGTGPEAAPPGTSAHERGIAVDLTTPEMRRAVDRLGAAYGWQKVEAPSEWWHVNYVG